MADSEIFGEEPQEMQLLKVVLTDSGMKVDTRLSEELTRAIVKLIAKLALGSEIDDSKTIIGG